MNRLAQFVREYPFSVAWSAVIAASAVIAEVAKVVAH